MAENTPEVVSKEKKSLVQTIGRTLRDMRGEIKKVVWPTRKQTVNNTAVVMVFMAIMGVLIGVFDLGFNALITLVLGRGA